MCMNLFSNYLKQTKSKCIKDTWKYSKYSLTLGQVREICTCPDQIYFSGTLELFLTSNPVQLAKLSIIIHIWIAIAYYCGILTFKNRLIITCKTGIITSSPVAIHTNIAVGVCYYGVLLCSLQVFITFCITEKI